jgi:hypothetical protein
LLAAALGREATAFRGSLSTGVSVSFDLVARKA